MSRRAVRRRYAGLLIGAVGVLLPVVAAPAASASAPLVYGPPQTLVGPGFRAAHALAMAADVDGDVFYTRTGPNAAYELPAGAQAATALPLSGLGHPGGIAVDATGDVFVADTDHDRVLELADGATKPTTLGFSGLNTPAGVAVDASGDVYVASSITNQVVELPAGGGPQVVVPFTGLANPLGVAVNDGNIYVTDSEHNRIVELAAGASTQTVLPEDVGTYPDEIAIDAGGDLFVSSDNGVSEIADGDSQSTTPNVGPEPPLPPIGVDPAGDLFVADGTILELAHGSVIPISLPTTALSGPSSVAVDGAGDAFLLDDTIGSARLLEVDHGASTPTVLDHAATGFGVLALQPSGTSWSRLVFGAPGSSSGVDELTKGSDTPTPIHAFDGVSPWGIAVDPAGDIYVSEQLQDKVLELGAGSSTVTTVSLPGLRAPDGLATDAAGDLFVVDTQAGQILELPVGTTTPVVLPFGFIRSPQFVAVDGNGDVFSADTVTKRIEEVAAGAGAPTDVPFAGLGELSGIAVDSAGNLYTTDATNGLLSESSFTQPISPEFTADAPPTTDPIGMPIRYTFAASGWPPPQFDIDGTLPTGVGIDTAGDLAGTPTGFGSYSYSIIASNAGGSVTSGPFTLIVGKVPKFVTEFPNSPSHVGATYSFQFKVSGYPAPTFAVASGSIPPGLGLDPTSGTLSGTPTTGGLYSFQVSATNALGIGETAIEQVEIDQAPDFTDAQPPATAQTGHAYSYQFGAAGYPAPTFAVASGSLPSGLTLDPNSGALAGTPTATGSSSFEISAGNSLGTAQTDTLTVVVDQRPAFTTDHPPATATVGRAYSYRLRATGYPEPTYRIESGHLPKGLHLSRATGEISGTPAKAGTAHFMVEAVNGIGTAARTSDLTIVVHHRRRK